MGRGVWQNIAHGVTKSQTQQGDFHFFHFWNWVMDRGQNNYEDLDCKSLDCLDQNITRNMNVEKVFAEPSDRNKKFFFCVESKNFK